MPEPAVEPEVRYLSVTAPADLLNGQTYVDRITRQLLVDLRDKAADAGLMLGDGPIELMVERDGPDFFANNRVTVRAESTVRLPRCGQDGRHEVPPRSSGPSTCPCGAVTRVPARKAG